MQGGHQELQKSNIKNLPELDGRVTSAPLTDKAWNDGTWVLSTEISSKFELIINPTDSLSDLTNPQVKSANRAIIGIDASNIVQTRRSNSIPFPTVFD